MTPRPGIDSCRVCLVALILPVLVAACASEPSIPLDAPEGWSTDGAGSWWTAGVDTSLAFRDMESFEAMEMVMEAPVYSADRLDQTQFAVGRYRVLDAVRTHLLPLYRNNPEIVDSLFWRYAADDILPTADEGDMSDRIAAYRRQAYRTIMRHYRPPYATVKVGRDVPVSVPDSLRELSAGRAVTFQVFVDSEGLPRAARKLEGFHPVMDRIAIRSIAQLEWQPAYLLRSTRSVPIDAWVRLGVRYPGEGASG